MVAQRVVHGVLKWSRLEQRGAQRPCRLRVGEHQHLRQLFHQEVPVGQLQAEAVVQGDEGLALLGLLAER